MLQGDSYYSNIPVIDLLCSSSLIDTSGGYTLVYLGRLVMRIVTHISLIVGCILLFPAHSSAQTSEANTTRITKQDVITSNDIATSYTPKPVQTVAVATCNGECDFWRCDIDRSGRCLPQDILEVIDLLNGGAFYDVFRDTPIGLCPSP